MRSTRFLPFLIVLAAGCARLGGSNAGTDHPLRVFVELESDNLAPGDAVVADVTVVNVTSEPMSINGLNYESLSFFLYPAGTEDGVTVEPVVSEREPAVAPMDLAGDGLVRRQFVFTTLTQMPGAWEIQASYRSDPAGFAGNGHLAASRRAGFTVTGERSLARDRDGLVLREQALRLAREYWGLEEDAALEARLVLNEGGFNDWMIRHGQADDAGGARLLFVNPYLGSVRREGDPALWEVGQQERREAPPVYRPRQ